MPDAPEAQTAEVQLPEVSVRQQAIDAATAELDSRPEADAVEGTAPATEQEPPPEAPPDPEPTPEPEHLSREEVDRLLDRQKASMRDQLRQAQAVTDRQNLLQELDALKEEDPDAYIERLEKDSNAASAVAERAALIQPELLARARVEVTMDQARMLFEARPDLEQIAEAQGEEWNEATNPQTGGVFGYIHRTALEQGRTQGVEDFKKSTEYKKAIEEAERRGAHNALGGIDSPPPQEDGEVVQPPRREYKDPRQAAVAAANQDLKRMVVDPSQVRSRRVA